VKRSFSRVCRALAWTVLLFAAGRLTAVAATTLPAGFAETLVTSVASPTALAFTPDGRLLITTQPGQLYVYKDGALLPPALTLDPAGLCTDIERGLLGVAVDPDFAANHFIYAYYTRRVPGRRCPGSGSLNRVVRFTLPDSNVIDMASQVVLLDFIPAWAGNHNAGDLHFGPDGDLYISVGDSGCRIDGSGLCAEDNNNARFLNYLTGKILRIAKDGGIPPDNPYAGAPGGRRCGDPAGVPSGTGPCVETYAWGLRNPFRFSFKPGTDIFYINDVGQDTWEEIDIGQKNADYGWNVREGHCAAASSTNCPPPPAGMTDPVFDYNHTSGCTGITGSVFVPGGVWPAPWDGAYLFADYVCGKIFRLADTPTGGHTWVEFATDLGDSSAVTMIFGPNGGGQSLYYSSYANGGEVRRIGYVGSGNRAPTAAATASPSSGPAPLSVTFDGSGSRDPDTGDTLTYLWTFGDGTPQASTIGPATSHTYAAGTYTAELVVQDNHGASSAPVSLPVSSGNTAPVPVIDTPAATDTFRVGEMVTLTGHATDAQDGSLPASSLSWTVIRHHAAHTHPFLGPVAGNGIQFDGPTPENLLAASNSYLEIRFTATDSAGLPATVTRDFQARKVDLSFATDPAGLGIKLEGNAVTPPLTVTSWAGYGVAVDAPGQTDANGHAYLWASWSDGGAASHIIATPDSPASYTAAFTPAPGDLSYFTLPPCRLADTRGPAGPSGGPALTSGSQRVFPVTGLCGVPATARVVAVNVTIVGPAGGGYLQLFRAGDSAPSTSVLNFAAGAVRSNDALVALGQDVGIAALATLAGGGGSAGAVHVVIDVAGYFE
jgi:glucose/arabinose dehydrogenase/PKD repeat protein